MRIEFAIAVLILTIGLSGCSLEGTKSENTVQEDNNTPSQENVVQPSPEETRDGQRYNDISTVYDALRDYQSAEQSAGRLPFTFPKVSYEALAGYLVPTYLDTLPRDPVRSGNYYYVVSETGYGFALGTWYESEPGSSWTQSYGIGDEPAQISQLLEAAMGPAPTF